MSLSMSLQFRGQSRMFWQAANCSMLRTNRPTPDNVLQDLEALFRILPPLRCRHCMHMAFDRMVLDQI